MNPENIMLSEISHVQKDKYCISHFYVEYKKVTIIIMDILLPTVYLKIVNRVDFKCYYYSHKRLTM